MDISISDVQKAKYLPALHEFSTSYKAALDIRSNLAFLIHYGRERLDFGMRQWSEVDGFPLFDYNDPYIPYEAKNLYFTAANAIYIRQPNEMCPWNILPESLNEIYFKNMLEGIKEYEKGGYRFNKGMAYANLGVAQAAQMKLDEGFANILKALIEDRGYSPDTAPEHGLRKNPLFLQFEERFVIDQLSLYVVKLGLREENKASNFIEEFLASLKDDQCLFFECTIVRIIQNWEIWQEKANNFTSNRLLTYIQDLCLFTEDLLKSKGFKGTLRPMIKEAFGVVCEKGCRADSLNDNISKHMDEKDIDAKCLRVLLTIRNFSSHNIAGGTSRDYFYKYYDEILMEILRAIFKIHEPSILTSTA